MITNRYLNTEIIWRTLLGLEDNGEVVVHHVRTGIKNHVHQGHLALVGQPILGPPSRDFFGIIASCMLPCPQGEYQDVVVGLHVIQPSSSMRTYNRHITETNQTTAKVFSYIMAHAHLKPYSTYCAGGYIFLKHIGYLLSRLLSPPVGLPFGPPWPPVWSPSMSAPPILDLPAVNNCYNEIYLRHE